MNDSSVNAYINLLGKTAEDRVTGLRGVMESVSFDLYGCVQIALKPPLDKDGKMQDGRWFDAARLKIDETIERRMPVPTFAKKPAEHDHGPAEKPARD
jgi:hypothetical protein